MSPDLFETTLALASVWDPVPIGIVSVWAVIGVYAIVVVVRLRDAEFGRGLGTALFALGGVGLLFLCCAQGAQRATSDGFIEAVQSGQRLRERPVRLSGCIVPESIEHRPWTNEYRFEVRSVQPEAVSVLKVKYTGLVPDAFRPAAAVVAEGAFAIEDRQSIVLEATRVSCPSPYEGDIPGGGACAEPRP